MSLIYPPSLEISKPRLQGLLHPTKRHSSLSLSHQIHDRNEDPHHLIADAKYTSNTYFHEIQGSASSPAWIHSHSRSWRTLASAETDMNELQKSIKDPPSVNISSSSLDLLLLWGFRRASIFVLLRSGLARWLWFMKRPSLAGSEDTRRYFCG